MADMQASIVLKLIDRLSPGLRKISKALGKVETRQTSSKAARAGRNQARMLKAQERAVAKLARSHQRLGRFSERAARAQLRLHRAAGKVSREFKRQAPMMANGLRKARNYALAGAGLVAAQAAAATAFIKAHLISPAAQFEKYGAALKGLEGSSEKARKSLDWVSTFAAETPFQLDQVMAAFVKLRSYGLDPTNGLLQTLGDAAAGTGKSVEQGVEAMADAVTGENERLKEAFGITTDTKGNKVTYNYTDKAGNQKQASVGRGNRKQILETLTGILNEKFKGQMNEQMATWNGMVSNLSDQFLRFKLMIMNAGLFDWMKDKLKGILDLVNKMQETGQLQVIAERISNALQTSLKAGWEMASVIAQVLHQIGSAISYAADAVGGYENLTKVILGLAGLKIASGVAVGLFSVAKGLTKVLAAARAGTAVGGAALNGAAGGGKGSKLAAKAGGVFLGLGAALAARQWSIDFHKALDVEMAAQGKTGQIRGLYLLEKLNGQIDAFATSMGQKLARTLTGSDVLLGQQLVNQFNKAKPKVMAAVIAIRDAAARIDWSAIGSRLVSAMQAAVERVKAAITSSSLYQAGVTMMETLLQGLKARALAVLNWAKSVATRIKGAFSLNLGASAGGGPKGTAGGRGGKPKARKRGGAFNASDNVMVNEGQPEIIRFGRSGTVSPSLTQALGGGRGPISVTNHITIQGNADRSTVAALVDQLDRRFRSSLHDIETVS